MEQETWIEMKITDFNNAYHLSYPNKVLEDIIKEIRDADYEEEAIQLEGMLEVNKENQPGTV